MQTLASRLEGTSQNRPTGSPTSYFWVQGNRV